MSLAVTIELVGGPSCGRRLSYIPNLMPAPWIDQLGWRTTYGPASRRTADGAAEVWVPVSRMPLDTSHPSRQP